MEGKMKLYRQIVASLLISFFCLSFIQKTEISFSNESINPLSLEKVIGLSSDPSAFRTISSSGWSYDACDKQGLAVASDGSIYIGDTAEGQINIFSKELIYIKSFGALGSGNGLFQQITCIAIDDKDQIYVLDGYHATVQVFKRDGTFIKKWGEEGELPHQLKTPFDLCFLKSGEILIADYVNGLKVFSPEGKYLREFSDDSILLPLESNIVEDMERDENGFIYIQIYNREEYEVSIHKFEENGNYLGKAVDIEPDQESKYISFDNMTIEGQYFYISCYSNYASIRRYKIPGNPKEKLSFVDHMVKTTDESDTNPTITDFFTLTSFESKNNMLYYLDGALNRLTLLSNEKKYMGTIQSSIMSSRYLYEKLEKKPFPLGYLRNPQGIRVDKHQRIFIGNSNYSCISIFDKNGSPVANLGKIQEEYDRVNLGELYGPTDIAFDEDENIFVTTTSSDSVQVFNKNFSPLSTIRQSFSSPQGIVFDAYGRLLVVNSDSRIVSVLENNSSKPKYKVTKSHPIEGQWPVGIDMNQDNNMVISSNKTNVIQIMNPDGEIIQTIGEEGTDPGQLSGPQGVMVDANNDIYVVETENGRIQKFSADGTLLWCSELNWMGLTFIAQDKEGLLYVTDCTHGLVLVIRDATAVPPKEKVYREIPPSGDFAITLKNNQSIKSGDTLTIQIKTSNISGLEFLQLSLLYPDQNLTYKATRLGSELKSKKFQLFPIDQKGSKITITSHSLGGSNYQLSGILLEIDFEVKASGTALLQWDELILKNASGKTFKPKSTKELTVPIE